MGYSIRWPDRKWLGPSRSELINYPDQVVRILTMPERHWTAFERIKQQGWDFCDVLNLALDMADTGAPLLGRDHDILHATQFVIATAERIVDGQPIHANDNDPIGLVRTEAPIR